MLHRHAYTEAEPGGNGKSQGQRNRWLFNESSWKGKRKEWVEVREFLIGPFYCSGAGEKLMTLGKQKGENAKPGCRSQF